ncbi:hypothetical protein AB0M39_35225 [Streptomyces sp. NPDC051907]|uniref:hypothetical protein n=1 Tax=Streptomyces sp. NPDC051907 TaxID=3155284 RepID=UPI0034126A2D
MRSQWIDPRYAEVVEVMGDLRRSGRRGACSACPGGLGYTVMVVGKDRKPVKTPCLVCNAASS